jgi:hypothetical protein
MAASKNRPMRRILLVALSIALLSLPPVAFAQANDYVVEDEAGDVSAGMADTRQPVPAVDTLPYIDVRKLEIRDLDEEILEFRLSNEEGFRPAPKDWQSSSYIGIQQIRHRVHFTVVGIGAQPTKVFLETDQLRLRIDNYTDAKTEVITTGVSLCVPLPGSQQCDYFSQFYIEHRIENGVLVMPVPKEFLTSQAAEAHSSFGGAGGASALPPRLYPGDKLTEIHVVGEEPNEIFATGLGMPTVDVRDRLPNEGNAPDFTFTYPSATNDLVIHYPPWSVVAGEENVIQIQVDNKAPVKRIVNFSLEQDLLAGDPWPASISPSATIPAGLSTNVTLRVKAPALKDGVGDYASFKIRGNVITQPGNVAIRTVYLAATAPLDKQHSTLFFTGELFNSGLPAGPSYGYGLLTRLDAVASQQTAPIPFQSYLSFGAGNSIQLMQYAWDNGGIPNPASFRPGEQGAAVLEVDSPAAFSGSLSVQLMQEDLVVAQHVGAIDLAQGRTTVEAPLDILPDVKKLEPANGTLFLIIEITGSGPEASAVNLAHFAGQEVSLVPKSTQFRLPIDRDYSVAPVAAPFKFSLAAAEDLEAFINPGKTQVFEFDLRNEETKAVRVELVPENKSADWNVEIRPGVRYRLAGNDSAHIGVLVSAPSTVKEGDQFTFQLRVRDSDTQLPVAVARIHLIVTSGVDIEDETFAAAGEDESKLETEAKKSPTVHALVPVLVVAFLAWRRRRAAQ